MPAIACLLLLPFFPLPGLHPGTNALIICISTIVIILKNNTTLNRATGTKFLAKIGDFSYSLYLVHWALICFMKNSWVGTTPDAPFAYRLGMLILSFPIAYLLYSTIEKPIRDNPKLTLNKSLILKLFTSSAILILVIPATLLLRPSTFDFLDARKVNYGFSKEC